MAGSQDFTPDPRNERALIYLNGELVRREAAMVSIFDAGFSMGDGVWEGIRLHKGALLFLDAHLDRLYEGARSIALDIGVDREGMKAILRRTLDANGMTDGAHLRLMVTRGLKSAVNQDPRNALGRPTIALTAEYKATPQSTGPGLTLATAKVRCTPREMFDMRLNSHSRLPLIRALIEAIEAGGDEALMLDPAGFVSSCNATNFFFVRDGELRTSTGEFCFNGITRGNVIDLAREHGVPIRLGGFPLSDVHAADEAFVTGTMAGVTPVRAIDGHVLQASPGPVTLRMRDLYADLKDRDAAAHPFVGAPA
ncbi:MAG TPA: aminotransferase class IV [Caulobacteraceae bacterium]|nr:aminotransferase class IV [Caulobacteraceae bacterium]